MTLQQATHPSYGRLDESELVALAQRGDREAFRAITQRCNQRLFRIARAIIQNESEAEDIVQEAYLSAFSRLEAFRGEANVLTWMTRITMNEALGRLRARRNAPDLANIVPFPTSSHVECPEAHAARMQIRRLIERAIDQLPLPFRLVFVMREIEGCSIQETADFLAIRPETVKTRLHRARRFLRSVLDDELGDVTRDVFPFLGVRCKRITDAVLARLGRTGDGSVSALH